MAFSISNFAAAVNMLESNTATPEDRNTAQTYLMGVLEHEDSWKHVPEVLATSPSVYARMFSIQILERTIQHRWHALQPQERMSICTFATGTLDKLCANNAEYYTNQPFISRFEDIIVAILINAYPREWPDFVDTAVSVESEPLAISMLNVLKDLAEETYDFSKGIRSNLVSTRALEIKAQLGVDFPKILGFAVKCLTNASVRLTADAAVALLCVFTGHVQGDVFLSQDMFNLIFGQLKTKPDSGSALELLHKILKNVDVTLLQVYQPAFQSPVLKAQCPTPRALLFTDIVQVISANMNFQKYPQAVSRIINAVLNPNSDGVCLLQEVEHSIFGASNTVAGNSANEALKQQILNATGAQATDNNIVLKDNPLIVSVGECLKLLHYYFVSDDENIHRQALKTLRYFLKHVCDMASNVPRETCVNRAGLRPLSTNECHLIAQALSSMLVPFVHDAIFKMPKPSEVLIKSTESTGGTITVSYDRLTNVDSIAYYQESVVVIQLLVQTNLETVKEELKSITNTIVTQLQSPNQLFVIRCINALSWSFACMTSMPRRDKDGMLMFVLPTLICQLDNIAPCNQNTRLILASSVMYIISSQTRFVSSSPRLLKAVIDKLFMLNGEYENSMGVFLMSTNALKILFSRCAKEINANKFVAMSDIFNVVLRGGAEIMEGVGSLSIDIKPMIDEILHADVQKLFQTHNNALLAKLRCILEGLHFYYKVGAEYKDETLSICMQLYRQVADLVITVTAQANIAQTVQLTNIIETVAATSLQVIASCVTRFNVNYDMIGLISSSFSKSPLLRRPETIELLSAILSKCLVISTNTDASMNINLTGNSLQNESPIAIAERLYSMFVQPQLKSYTDCTSDLDMRECCFSFLKQCAFTINECTKGAHTLSAIDPLFISRLCDDLLFGLRHQSPKIVDLSLKALLHIVTSLRNLDTNTLQLFLAAYYERLITTVMSIIVDTFHTENIKEEVCVVQYLILLVTSADTPVRAPLNANYTSNVTYVQTLLFRTICAAYPNMTQALVQQFVESVTTCTDPETFQVYVEDLIKLSKRKLM